MELKAYLRLSVKILRASLSIFQDLGVYATSTSTSHLHHDISSCTQQTTSKALTPKPETKSLSDVERQVGFLVLNKLLRLIMFILLFIRVINSRTAGQNTARAGWWWC